MTEACPPAAVLPELARRLRASQRVVVLTGAGISQESGIPTFRGPEGLWRNFRPEDLATPQAFKKDPLLVWEWYDWRRGRIATARPNAAHLALAALEAEIPDFLLLTQNVDGLHRQAGSRRLLEIHGSIWEVRCTGCGITREDRRHPLPLPPQCPECGSLLRPNVVWFGEALDPEIIKTSQAALLQAQVMLVVGTSGVVQPAASFALLAKERGARLAEINPVPTPLTPYSDFLCPGKAGEVLPALLQCLERI
ncbi:MAG: NAD-dependent deacylase [Thermodesulfobacteriota bacterium]